MSIPGVSIADLKANYPKEATKEEVVTEIFGDKHWLLTSANLNTCAIRLSKAFNYSGQPLKRKAGLVMEAGLDGKLYLIRAGEFVTYCKSEFKAPDVVKSAGSDADLTAAISGKPGVLFFRLKKERKPGVFVNSSLFGHADVWDGAEIWFNDVLWETWEVTLWKV